MDNTYSRMVIGEAINDDQLRELRRVYETDLVPVLQAEPGFESARLLIEEGGRLAVSVTFWKTRDACLRYHSSRSYRQFVAKTQHLLVGDFVVKLFQASAAIQEVTRG